MKKTNGLIIGVIVLSFIIVWFAYQNVTDDTYEGMSIIPERRDIPLFTGLEPTRSNYVMEGNQWKEIKNFYFKKLPKRGWNVVYKDTSPNKNGSGFITRWRKHGLEWGLSVYSSYSETNNQTEVIFDKTLIHHSKKWIESIPKNICIYKNTNDNQCAKIRDQAKIKKVVQFINNAIDWKEKMESRVNESVIVVGDIKINVHYEEDKTIYFQSKKGLKSMKPDPGFFKLTNLSVK
ncbi:hypothetical protein [Virgibacillus sp. JSM 102003]|uniref:hypothetical protein n=1 Tax=Virgibacillus sp. JSM 102003 TaxID=1562108 RepID=UPI0035C01A41